MNDKTGWITRQDLVSLAKFALQELDVIDRWIANLYPQNTAECMTAVGEG
jgi:hypothetical protein